MKRKPYEFIQDDRGFWQVIHGQKVLVINRTGEPRWRAGVSAHDVDKFPTLADAAFALSEWAGKTNTREQT